MLDAVRWLAHERDGDGASWRRVRDALHRLFATNYGAYDSSERYTPYVMMALAALLMRLGGARAPLLCFVASANVHNDFNDIGEMVRDAEEAVAASVRFVVIYTPHRAVYHKWQVHTPLLVHLSDARAFRLLTVLYYTEGHFYSDIIIDPARSAVMRIAAGVWHCDTYRSGGFMELAKPWSTAMQRHFDNGDDAHLVVDNLTRAQCRARGHFAMYHIYERVLDENVSE